MALTGGLLVFFFVIFGLCLIPYNAFLRDLIVTEQILKTDNPSSIKVQDIGFIFYIKYQVFRFFKLFFKKENKKLHSKKIEENLR